MKKILIVGAGSYIGVSFERFLAERCPGEYAVDTVDTLGDWQSENFAGYDVVFHVAGLAHQKETPEKEPLYYAVNRDLAVAVAEKAKAEGVSQFVFLSTMNIYGKEVGVITPDTEPAPKTYYGKSKWEAEQLLAPLGDDSFTMTVLRPPMVYGKDCRGNFQTVVKLVRKFPFFPRVHNARSLIHIDNLSSFVKKCVDERLDGVYFPQNREYVDTMEMARELASAIGKKRYFSFVAGWGVMLLRTFLPMAQKAFGNLVYMNTEVFDYDYCVVDGNESFRRSI